MLTGSIRCLLTTTFYNINLLFVTFYSFWQILIYIYIIKIKIVIKLWQKKLRTKTAIILLEITKGVEKGGVQLKAQTKRKIASEWYSVPLRHCFLDGPHTLPLQNARAISLSYSTHALAEMGQCLVLSKIRNGLSQYSFDRPWTFRAPF